MGAAQGLSANYGGTFACAGFQQPVDPHEHVEDAKNYGTSPRLEGDMWPLHSAGDGDGRKLPGQRRVPAHRAASSKAGPSQGGNCSGIGASRSRGSSDRLVLDAPEILLNAAALPTPSLDISVEVATRSAILPLPRTPGAVSASRSASPKVGLHTLAECCSPLLAEVAGYVACSPSEFVRSFYWTSRVIAMEIAPISAPIWEHMYKLKWPAFHDYMTFQGMRDWCLMWKCTLAGAVCVLEVFDREKKLGFAMAAMAAQVRYDRHTNEIIARYLSASEVPPEHIPEPEWHRLRFCPTSARPKLQPGLVPSSGSKICIYPYRVLEGLDGLVVGKGVELQWKMQYASPFGWWYGHLEALELGPSPGLAAATITFPHFPPGSPWYRLQVVVGDDKMRVCAFGGYTGGLRGVSQEERKRWMQFFPRQPVVF